MYAEQPAEQPSPVYGRRGCPTGKRHVRAAGGWAVGVVDPRQNNKYAGIPYKGAKSYVTT